MVILFNKMLKLMNRILFVIGYCLCCGFCLAQQPTTAEMEQNLRMLGNLNALSPGLTGFDNRYEGVQGSPFLFDNWTEGTLQFAKQDTFSKGIVRINIDLIKQVILVPLRDGTQGEMSALNIKAFRAKDGRTWITATEKEVEGSSSVRLKFYEVIYQGNRFALFKSVGKRYHQADFKGAYSSNVRHDEFVTEVFYWLNETGEKPQKFKVMRRKNLETALPAHQAAIKKLVQEHKLNLNDEKDAALLLQMLDK